MPSLRTGGRLRNSPAPETRHLAGVCRGGAAQHRPGRRNRRREQVMGVNGTASRVEVAIVGAGQAGLAVSYYLRAFGVEHVVLERGRVGESWRSARWDSFTLVTPNWMTRLPGYRMAAGSGGDFVPRDDVVAMLEALAAGLPVREQTEVTSVAAGSHGYQVATAT